MISHHEDRLLSLTKGVSPKIAKEVVVKLRDKLLHLPEHQRVVFIEEFLRRNCWKKVVTLLAAAWEVQEGTLLIEITWIFQIVFGTMKSLVPDIMEVGIMPIYEKMLKANDQELLDNVA